MLKVVNNGISLTRGDTATFRLQIKNQDGTDYEITPDDQVLFTVKRSPNDEKIVIQKAAANNCITIYATGAFTLNLATLSALLGNNQSTVFTAYITAGGDYALSITNGGTIKYIGAASDLAITSAGLLLNILMTKDGNGSLTSIVQANKLT